MRSEVVISRVWTLIFQQESTVVYSDTPERDPAWRFTDAAGHEHSGEKDWPTLAWVVVRGWYCDEHQEMHGEGEWRCRLCGEAITPGMRGPDFYPKQIPGPASYELVYDDGSEKWIYPIPPDRVRWSADLAEWAEDIAATVPGILLSRKRSRDGAVVRY